MTKRMLVGGALAIGLAIAVVIAVSVRSESTAVAPTTVPAQDPTISDFRAVERTCLTRYNAALADQRANKLDEVELANTIERDVLTPWRALRARVDAAPTPAARTELYGTLRHYLEARQIAWEAYVAALRSPTDETARPHLDTHHQKNAEAQDDAKQLGRMFRDLGL